MTRTAPLRRRLAFTLVELLVVVALIILLAAMVVVVSQSGLVGSQKVVSAADRASGWLLIAKQRALRDQAPRGVRFLMTDMGGGYFQVRDAQYIEAPDPWVPNPDQELNPTGPRIVFSYQFNTATGKFVTQDVYYVSFDPNQAAGAVANVLKQNDMTEFDQRVGVGDMLRLPEFGTSFLIIGKAVPPTAIQLQMATSPTPVVVPPSNCRLITLQTKPDLSAAFSPMVGGTVPLPQGTLMTYKYGFQSQPRPLLGEPTVQLTGSTAIDLRWNVATGLGNPSTTLGVTPVFPPAWPNEQAYFDILFAPSGAVMYNPSGLICLWVRDPDKVPHPRLDPATGTPNDFAGFNAAGEQVLVTIYTGTGLIATHPVNPSGLTLPTYDPYQYAKDGINSGL
jgi:Tfp pilus assembly protein FimT